jgi:hypothetical protein
MESTPARTTGPSAAPSYRWPWFVLGGVILAVVLAVVWMSFAVKRTRMIRDLSFPHTNASP